MTETSAISDDSLRERLVALTRDLILIPSDATRPREIDRGLAFLKNHLEALPHVQIQDFKCKGDRGVLRYYNLRFKMRPKGLNRKFFTGSPLPAHPVPPRRSLRKRSRSA